MSEIRLFSLSGKVTQLKDNAVALEKELQNLIENNLETFFGVRFVKSEYAITDGRMDSIGLDENNSPVIFEYKRSTNENVINQGLFYLDWLLDHKAEFEALVKEKLGQSVADSVDWSVPCVMCIAKDFTKYDEHAVKQMQRNIKLIKYKKYGKDLILFELINNPTAKPIEEASGETVTVKKSTSNMKSHAEKLASMNEDAKTVYASVCDYIESLGDDISMNQVKYYVAYKKIQNFVCIEVYKDAITLYLKLEPKAFTLEDGFSRDVSTTGHRGTGDLEITLRTLSDFEKAKEYISKAYENS